MTISVTICEDQENVGFVGSVAPCRRKQLRVCEFERLVCECSTLHVRNGVHELLKGFNSGGEVDSQGEVCTGNIKL